jgi:hypothetical protein
VADDDGGGSAVVQVLAVLAAALVGAGLALLGVVAVMRPLPSPARLGLTDGKLGW